MSKSLSKVTLLVLALGLAALPAVHAAGSKKAPTPDALQGPQEVAVEHYNKGLDLRDEAWKLEEQAVAAGAEKGQKLLGKAAEKYEKAIKEFKVAVAMKPDFYQAMSSLGYASRKIGRFDDSLRAYDEALALAPDYSEAIEYRAEAYLGLGQIEEAKAAYIDLFGRDRERADQLMTAMKGWIEERRADPAGVPADQVDELAEWVAEREEIARQTAKLSVHQTGQDW